MKLFESKKDETIARFEDPQVGDCFTEMYSYYVWILGRHDGRVQFCNSHDCKTKTIGNGGRYEIVEVVWDDLPLDDFKAKYAYGSIPGYLVRFVKNNPKWAESLNAQIVEQQMKAVPWAVKNVPTSNDDAGTRPGASCSEAEHQQKGTPPQSLQGEKK